MPRNKKNKKKNQQEETKGATPRNGEQPSGGCCTPQGCSSQAPQQKKVVETKSQASGGGGCCDTGGGCCGPEEEPKTAQEKTQEYIDNQQKVHQQFIDRFKLEEESLSIDPEIEQKKEVWAKREADEVKKLDKLIKKERNDFEDISSTGSTNVKQVHDRIMKTLNQVRKINNQYYQIK